MKSKFLVGVALLLGVFLAGCSSSVELNKITIGMPKAEVINILGTPDSTSAQSNVEYLTYYLVAGGATGYGRDQPYMVRLVNGKVESFGRFAQLFDLYNRPITNAVPGDSNFPGPGVSTVTVAQPQAQASFPLDYATQLERLQALKEKGVISQEEFDTLKAKLIGK